MKKALLALAVVAFVAAGAAQPAMAQQNQEDIREPDVEINNSVENETNRDETNETERPESPGKSAQFDARLGVAIDTVSTLVEIAPNEEAKQGLQNALDQLREVQNNTDTASLGPEERPEGPERPDEIENKSTEEENKSSEEGQQGPPEDRGPSQNSNRPGFVNQMLSGIFG